MTFHDHQAATGRPLSDPFSTVVCYTAQNYILKLLSLKLVFSLKDVNDWWGLMNDLILAHPAADIMNHYIIDNLNMFVLKESEACHGMTAEPGLWKNPGVVLGGSITRWWNFRHVLLHQLSLGLCLWKLTTWPKHFRLSKITKQTTHSFKE